jgi:HAMP domain-containing protein
MSEPTSTLSPEMRPFALVMTAIANGDFSQQVPLQTPTGTPLQGEALELARTLNAFAEQLKLLTNEITRVSIEMGTEHKFGGQIEVPGATGSWHEMVGQVNTMSGNLTTQLRDIYRTTQTLQQNGSAQFEHSVQGELVHLQEAVQRLAQQRTQLTPEEVFDTSDINPSLKGT